MISTSSTLFFRVQKKKKSFLTSGTDAHVIIICWNLSGTPPPYRWIVERHKWDGRDRSWNYWATRWSYLKKKRQIQPSKFCMQSNLIIRCAHEFFLTNSLDKRGLVPLKRYLIGRYQQMVNCTFEKCVKLIKVCLLHPLCVSCDARAIVWNRQLPGPPCSLWLWHNTTCKWSLLTSINWCCHQELGYWDNAFPPLLV